jgi:hypothetical protein
MKSYETTKIKKEIILFVNQLTCNLHRNALDFSSVCGGDGSRVSGSESADFFCVKLYVTLPLLCPPLLNSWAARED